MTTKFKNSLARVDRAITHLLAFKNEFDTIFADCRASTVCRYDRYGGWFIASVVLPSSTIERIERNVLSLEIGEYAYQLRAALDGLIWDAITFKQGAEPPADANRIEFPIIDGVEKKFENCAFLKFPFPDKLRGWLESIQPYTDNKPEGHPDRGLNTALEDIHNLARLDRHRRLRIIAAVPTELKFGVRSDARSKIVARERIDTCDIFNGQYEFLRFRLETPDGKHPEQATLHTELTFEVIIEDIEPFEEMNIGIQMRFLAEAVRYIIKKFDEEFCV